MDQELQNILKALRLGGLLSHWEERLAEARQGRFSHERSQPEAAAGPQRSPRGSMNFDEFRQRADAVRQIPLEAVLTFRGAVRDGRDRAKWHTERGPLSVTDSKFTAWHTSHGGGGAIDLAPNGNASVFRFVYRVTDCVPLAPPVHWRSQWHTAKSVTS